MEARCYACGYKSGGFPDLEKLAEKVNQDGGLMELVNRKGPAGGTIIGWRIICPTCQDGNEIFVD